MTRTKRTLVRWLVLAAVLLAGDRLFARGIEGVLLTSGFRFSRLYSGSIQDRCVLILGNSRAVNAFYVPALTQKLGVPVESLAYNGVSMEIAEALLLDYLDQGKTPRLVVVELSAIGVDSAVMNELKLYTRRSPRLAAIGARETPLVTTASRISHLFALNGELLLRNAFYLRRSDQDWINTYRITDQLIAETDSLQPVDLPVDDRGFAALGRIVRTLGERDIPVRLLIAPYFPGYVKKLANLDRWVGRVEAAVGPGHRVWNLSRALESKEFFADRIHSNDAGARALADRLQSERFFELERAAHNQVAPRP